MLRVSVMRASLYWRTSAIAVPGDIPRAAMLDPARLVPVTLRNWRRFMLAMKRSSRRCGWKRRIRNGGARLCRGPRGSDALALCQRFVAGRVNGRPRAAAWPEHRPGVGEGKPLTKKAAGM